MIRSFHDRLPNPIQKVGEHQVIKTPSALVDRILDGFPEDVWSDRAKKWLVPVSKSGIFELGIYERLMAGLAPKITDFEERRNWVVKEMIYSFALTRASDMFIRRYFLGKVWNDIRGWTNLEGNVMLVDFLKMKINNNGEIMAKKTADGKEKFVKFDCIVGNPPYQKNSGDTSDVALYPDFVQKAITLAPQYMSMVIPSKWMMGDGKGTSKFLQTMLECNKLSSITTTDNSREWFSDIDLKGGAMYFLFDSGKEGTITNINGKPHDLSSSDVIITDAVAIDIKNKVSEHCRDFFDTTMYGQNPYGINTNHNVWTSNTSNAHICHCSGGQGRGSVKKLIAKDLVSKNLDTVDKWKLCIAKNSGKGKDGTGHSFIAAPGAIITQSYLILGCFNSEAEAKNAASYIDTPFAQFMSSILKGTQNVSKRVFKWLPYLDFSRQYTDKDLYDMFHLSDEQIKHIVDFTKGFPLLRSIKLKQQDKSIAS